MCESKIYIAVLVLLILVLVYIFVFRSRKNKEKTLYERLGGIYNIAAVVDRFSDQIIMNPKVGANSPNPVLKEWSTTKLESRLPGLKWMRTLWVCDITGGPYKYVATKPGKCPLSLENAHKDFHISSDEFDEVASELGKALDYYKVQEKEKTEVLTAFAKHKNEIVNPTTNSLKPM